MRGVLPVFFSLATLSTGWANEALRLLDESSDTAPNVYQSVARVKASKAKPKTPEPVFPKYDVTLPERWDPEVPAWFTHEFENGNEIAARGLFQYDHRGHRFARGGKLSRARLGFALQTYYGIQLEADALFSSGGDYEGLEQLVVKAPLTHSTELSVGKIRIPFSSEYTRDASVRWFPELSPFLAQIVPPNSLGAMLEGTHHDLDWKLGWFSSDTDQNLPSARGRSVLLASLASAKNLGGSEGNPRPRYRRWHLDYLYQPNPGGIENLSRSYRHLLSTGLEFSSDLWDLQTDLLVARGRDGNAYAATLAGAYWILPEAVRFVTRYHHAVGEGEGAILSGFGIPDTGSAASQPFDFPVTTPAGELISVYGGLNFHLYANSLIVATGLEYRTLGDVVGRDDFDSWGWKASARLAF